MSNLKVLVFPVLIVLTLVFIWQFVWPMYNEGNTFRKKIPQLTAVIAQEKDLQQRTGKLFQEINNSEANASLAINAIPSEKKVKDLISQIDYVVKKSNLTLEGISVDDKSESIQGAETTANSILGETEEYKKTAGSVQVGGSYSNFKLFLKELSKMSRLVNVESISVRNSSDQSGEVSGRYELKFVVYHLPSVTAEQVKSGLESRE